MEFVIFCYKKAIFWSKVHKNLLFKAKNAQKSIYNATFSPKGKDSL